MAANKKSFLLYCDLIHTVDQMPNELAGELFKHILSYVNDQNPVSENLIINLTFEPIKQSLKRDLVKYESIVEQKRQAGLASAESRKQKQQMLTRVESVEQKPTKSTDSVSDSVSVNVKDNKYNISPEVKKLRVDCKNYFLDYYLQKKGSEFYWSTKDAANLNKLIAKVEFKVKEKNGSNYTNEDILVGFKLILSNIKDNWIIDNLSIPNINSKFNEIFTQITNGKTSKDKYAGSEFRN